MSVSYNEAATADQFVRLAHAMAISEGKYVPWGDLAKQFSRMHGCGRIASFCKAAVAGASVADTWTDSDGQILTSAFLATAAPHNLASALARYALPIPNYGRRILLAEGVVAEGVAEGQAKPLVPVSVGTAEAGSTKVAAMIVATRDVLKVPGPDTEALFRRLLTDAVIRASNAAVMANLTTTSVSGGSTAADSLRIGLSAAGDATGYVVATTPAVARELALASDGRMGVNGGTYIEGVEVVAALEATSGGPDLIVIPASQVAMRDEGLELRIAGHATVEMADNPTNHSVTPTATQQVSLFQTNSIGLLCERRVTIYGDLPAVEVT